MSAFPFDKAASPFLASVTKELIAAELLKLEPSHTTQSSTRPKRCCAEGCKKKLSLLDIECRCGKVHCSLHRQAELHACQYDFKNDGLKVLEKQLGEPVCAKKLDKV